MITFSQFFKLKIFCLHDLPLDGVCLIWTSCLKHIGTYEMYQQTFTTLQWQLERFHLRFHVFYN